MKKIDPNFIRLSDMIQAIDDAESYTSNLQDKKTLHAILYNIAIIGEAAAKLLQALKEAYPSIPWAAIINMRHRIVHDYGNINVSAIKDILENDLPALRQQIQVIHHTLKP